MHRSIPRLALALGFLVAIAGCCGKYKDQIADQEKALAALEGDKAGLAKIKADLEGKIDNMAKYQSALENELEKAGIDRSKLASEFESAQAGLLATQQELEAKMADLEAKQKIIEEMKKKEELAQKRLATLKDMLTKFKNMIESGKLKVKVKNGKMVLELPSAILFDSGKADLSDEGELTLAEVAKVLSTIGDREFQVAGHTDNVPLGKGSKFTSNWELSTARAVKVVEYLQQMGVSPKNLSAAGYSEYQPSAKNDSDEGKGQNRRIEITLMPNLDELPDLSDLEKSL